jgi:hypothetical protein
MARGQTVDEDQVGRTGISRRQAMGRMTAVATAGAAAWVIPEILTATPAAGAALSGTGSGGGGSVGVSGNVSTSASTGGSPAAGASVGASGSASTDGPNGVRSAADTTATAGPSSLAFTGLNIERDAAVGAALVAGGWAMQHWASRLPRGAASGVAGAAAER